MTAMVRINAGDRAVTIHRNEAGGEATTLQPGQHETFTVRAHESITIVGDEAEALAQQSAIDQQQQLKPPPKE